MSDQTPDLGSVHVIDGSRIINVAGATGLTSINGDATPAQLLIAGTPNVVIADLGGGSHTISVAAGGGGNIISINADVTPAQQIQVTAPLSIADGGGGLHTISIATFGGVGTPGIVDAPAGVATDYLARDGTFKTIPAGGAGITSINADVTAAQVIAVSGALNIVDGGGGLHTLSVDTFAGAGAPGIVPDPVAAAPKSMLTAAGTFFAMKNTDVVFLGGNLNNHTETTIMTFTVPAGESGEYLIFAAVGFNNDPTGDRGVILRHNGTYIMSHHQRAISDAFGTGNVVPLSCYVAAGVGDTITIGAIQTSGGILALVAGGITVMRCFHVSQP